MTGNKILGSSAPRAVFVLFGGNGGPSSPGSTGPQALVSGHAPAVGGLPARVAASGLTLAGLRLVRLCSRRAPSALGLAQCWGPAHSPPAMASQLRLRFALALVTGWGAGVLSPGGLVC